MCPVSLHRDRKRDTKTDKLSEFQLDIEKYAQSDNP